MPKPLFVPKSGGWDRPVMDAGSYVTRCIQVVDLGTQTMDYNGEIKEQRKIRLTFEFPTEMAVFSEEKGEQPFVLGADFTLSMHEKGKLRPFLESWRGKSFEDDETDYFDIFSVLGKDGMAGVIHETGKRDGKTYARLASVNKMPKWFECPPAINPVVAFSLEDFEQDSFDMLPEFVQQKIMASREFKEFRNRQDSEPSFDN